MPPPSSTPRPPGQSLVLTNPSQRILAILLLPIGDTLFCTPAIHALRVAFPHAHITALVYTSNGGILVNNVDIDHIWHYPTRNNWGVASVLRLGLDLRRGHFDLSVEFSNYNAWLARWAHTAHRTHRHLPPLWWVAPQVGRALRNK